MSVQCTILSTLCKFEHFLNKKLKEKKNRKNYLGDNKANSGNKRKLKNIHTVSSGKLERLLKA